MIPRCLLVLSLLAATAWSQTAALVRLENSPRHHEWIAVDRGGRTVHAFVAYPEVAKRAMVVLVIHENRGLNDWARAVADRLAEAGYIAVAPDLLSGAAPGGGRTRDFPSADAAREALGKLDAAEVLADLNAVADHARRLPAADGRLAVAGFCWGGTQAWRVAAARPDLVQAHVFYGSPPAEAAAYAAIRCPVLGYYGGNDARINATIDQSAAAMRAAGKSFAPVIYEGAGHAFMRAGEEADAASPNHQALVAGWQRLLAALAAER
ncbi:MAG: dienelactone hydrolase family protein [Opitutaceae bacterium]|nr:dienelactone hydrolase family protein [Opitutaceae bacterium]